MSLNTPLVSICIPTYNSSIFLQHTLNSVLSQSYENIEVILCDDASTDNTIEIIESYQDYRIKLFRNPKNLGVAENWNRCISLANGDFIKMMGADDTLYPDCMKEQAAIFQKDIHQEISLVISSRDIISPENKVIMNRKFPFFTGKISSKRAIRINFWFGTNVIGEPVSGLFRSDFVKNGGRYSSDNLYLIDLDFWCKILQSGNLYVINKPLSAFRISSNSLSSSLRFEQAGLYHKFARKLYQRESSLIKRHHVWIGYSMALMMQLARKVLYCIYFRK
jgi:glycosyltransferase involved in cell wall biosynthesis